MGKLRCLLIFNLQLSIKRDGFDKYKGSSSQEINTEKAPISYFLSSRQCLNHCSVYIYGLPSQGGVYDACTCGQLCWVLIYPFPSGYHFLFLTWQPFYGYPENNFINKSFSLSHGEGKAMRWFSYSRDHRFRQPMADSGQILYDQDPRLTNLMENCIVSGEIFPAHLYMWPSSHF